MKVLLSNPPCRIKLHGNKERYFLRAGSRWPFSVTKERTKLLEYLPFPFYLAYASALLRKENIEIDGIDSVALNETEEEYLSRVIDLKPDLIIFESPTPTIKYDALLIKRLRKSLKNLIICLCGPHVSIYPRSSLKELSVDFLLQREYEVSLKDLCVNLEKKRDIVNVPGLVFRKGGRVTVNPPVFIDDINILPFPDREIFPLKERSNPTLYWDGFCQNRPAIQMHASRGCPFRCNFCLWNQVMYGNGKYRTFSASRVVEEMVLCQKKYKAKEIYFDDDTFTGSKEHVLQICQQIRRKKLKISWSAMADAMITDREMIEEMTKSGCIGLKFGVESGDEAILRRIGKPIDFNKVKDFCSWCARRRIKTHATFTLGLSGETKETMAKTLSFAQLLDADSVQFSITTPFPGTRYYEEVKKKKLLKAKNWEDFDGANKAIVKFENLTSQEVENYYELASSRWLRSKVKNPDWVARQFVYLWRQVKGQGVRALFSRSRRFLKLFLQT